MKVNVICSLGWVWGDIFGVSGRVLTGKLTD
jgi:hypothetical protein